MFTFTSVHVLSVLKIAPGTGGSSTGSAFGAKNGPATITAIKAVHIHLLLFTFIYLTSFNVCLGSLSHRPVQDGFVLTNSGNRHYDRRGNVGFRNDFSIPRNITGNLRD